MSNILLHKINQYWPNKDPEEIFDVLKRYGQEEYERESSRVQLAILKLSAGDLTKLEEYMDLAKKDYRDVLAYAEYPEEMRMGFLGMRELSEDQAKALRQRDRQQYLAWLNS